MALTPQDIPELLTSGLRTEFMGDKGFGMPQPDVYKQICTEIPSTKSSETYAWLGELPKMREWLGDRTLHSLSEHTFTIENKDFEATIAVKRNAIDDDQYGQVKIKAQMLGQEARRYYDELLFTVIEANGLCYDGQNFFDTDHSEGDSGTQSNAPAAASTYTIDTASDCIDVLNLVSSAVAQIKGDKGVHFGAKVTHVLVPTSLEWTFRQAFDPQFSGPGETSETKAHKGRVQVVVSEFLTNNAEPGYSAVYWLDLSKPIKPFIFQNRKSPEFVSVDKPDSWANFMRKDIYYGVDDRFNMGFGLWQLAYKTQGAE